ncbi:MBL fold metallo-hydrolase RNA specificity domain-containing protein [Micromonospora echinofusca]|uniref:MBL fold metallo-hydrolase RNA specificity domain-containing protein n=1 Tax=Micromonospora echinofusca TaxID=47858 RepID=UPI0037105F8B
MSRTLPQLVQQLVLDAARHAVQAPALAGTDPHRLAQANRRAMLQLIARRRPLREELTARYSDEPTLQQPTVRALLSGDAAVAESAANTLTDPAGVRRLARSWVGSATPAPVQASPADGAAPVDRRQHARTARKIADLQEARDVARAQRNTAQAEARDLARQLAATQGDLEEAGTVIEALRAELNLEREAAAARSTDLLAATAVLAAAAAPSGTGDTDDPRTRELANDATAVPSDTRLAAALAAAGVAPAAFRAVLATLLTPPIAPVPAVATPREIALTPLGAGTEIGGSAMLVSAGDVRILVDAGMRPKRRIDDAGPPHIDVVRRSGRLDAIVITHAHNDHAGYVPALTAQFANVPVFCTAETAALLPTMWQDSVKVFDRTRSDYVEAGEPPAEPPYTRTQALAAQRRLEPIALARTVEVADGVTIELFPAGHILGAAGVVVTAGDRRVTVTGDVSTLAQLSVPGLIVPDAARGSDLLVIESTYCGQRGTNRDLEVEKFINMVAETVSAGGRVLVPAFALGRAQEVALTLRDRLPDVPVLIDGLARHVSWIYEQETAGTDRPLRIYGDGVQEVRDTNRPYLLKSFRKGVVVTTSGMLAAGPAVRWAREILPDPNSALLVAGYQDEDSPGAELLDLSNGGNGTPAGRGGRRTFRLDADDVAVNARVEQFGLSAHADRRGLSAIINEVAPREVMLVHGVERKQRDFADNLTRRGYAVAPTRHWQR